MRLSDYYVPRESVDREGITHVDFDAQTPLPARLPERRRYFLLDRWTLVGAVLAIAALIVLRGCR